MRIYLADHRYAPDLLHQPKVEVTHWLALKRSDGALHLSVQLPSGPLRVSTPLVALIPGQLTLITESGRHYRVPAQPVSEAHALAPLFANAAACGLGEVTDVSSSVWHALKTGQWPTQEHALVSWLQ
ncbi:hypothetical protein [Roseateles noduli]|uniref:hypothetical protein n=1 Tax=Roseateles noduli TaxID=2052484 RepID=UPI003D65D695